MRVIISDPSTLLVKELTVEPTATVAQIQSMLGLLHGDTRQYVLVRKDNIELEESQTLEECDIRDGETLERRRKYLFDAFISYAWGTNKPRVGRVQALLERRGIKTWFDDNQMEPGKNITSQITRGMDLSRTVVMFIDSAYYKKIIADDFNNNCYIEFQYATGTRMGPNKIITVLMDSALSDPKQWSGNATVVSSILYLDYTTDLQLNNVCDGIEKLIATKKGLKSARVSQDFKSKPLSKLFGDLDLAQLDRDTYAMEQLRAIVHKLGGSNLDPLTKMLPSELAYGFPESYIQLSVRLVSAWALNREALGQEALVLALDILGNLALASINAPSIVRARGPYACLEALRHDHASEAVQASACRCLGHIAKHNVDADIQLLWDLKTHEVVLDVWKRSPKIRAHAIMVMEYISLPLRNQPTLFKMQLHIHALQAMRNATEVASIQSSGCRIIASLAGHEDHKLAIAEAGSPNVVIKAMQDFPTDVLVQRYACLALCKLASDFHRVSLKSISSNGGIALVVAAIRNHMENAAVCENGSAALNVFCNSARVFYVTEAIEVFRVGGGEVLLKMMERHLGVGAIQENGCRVLYAMAQVDQLRQPLVDLGALRVVRLSSALNSTDTFKLLSTKPKAESHCCSVS